MNLGIESETLEFKKTTGEIEKAVNKIIIFLGAKCIEMSLRQDRIICDFLSQV